MTLETYITDLLYRYECVIVPNFGGFVANAKSAKVNENTFSPPYKQITFNSLLQNNDGLLANYIAQVDKMPYETAVNFIDFEVQEWVDKLLDEELDLKGLGTLFLVNDKIQFEPENTVNYLTSSFGLSRFISDDIERKTPMIKQPIIELQEQLLMQDIVVGNQREVYKEQVEKIEETTPIFITPEKRRNSSNFIKYAAIFVLSASLIGLGNKMYKDNVSQKQVVEIQQKQKDREAKIQTATFVIDAPLPTITLNTTSTKKEIYHIIAGAFRSEVNANKKVNQLLSQGFNAKIIGTNKWNLTQVAFTSFSDLETANTELATIKNTIASDAWLLVRK